MGRSHIMEVKVLVHINARNFITYGQNGAGGLPRTVNRRVLEWAFKENHACIMHIYVSFS